MSNHVENRLSDIEHLLLTDLNISSVTHAVLSCVIISIIIIFFRRCLFLLLLLCFVLRLRNLFLHLLSITGIIWVEVFLVLWIIFFVIIVIIFLFCLFRWLGGLRRLFALDNRLILLSLLLLLLWNRGVQFVDISEFDSVFIFFRIFIGLFIDTLHFFDLFVDWF